MKVFDLIKKVLRSKGGESIMEAVVSLLILGILMTTVVTIIRFSMVMTGNSIINAADSQEGFNQIITVESGAFSPSTLTLTFSHVPDPDAFVPVIDVNHLVNPATEENVTAFRPAD
jgi:hypothetical protein